MARDVVTMFNELKALADAMPSCMLIGRDFRRNWKGSGGLDGGSC
jgi:hypothetical protein